MLSVLAQIRQICDAVFHQTGLQSVKLGCTQTDCNGIELDFPKASSKEVETGEYNCLAR